MAKINIILHINLQLIFIVSSGNMAICIIKQKTFVFTIVAFLLVQMTCYFQENFLLK